MPITRLNRSKLNNLIDNLECENDMHVIKFYSDTCPMCLNLKSYYADISEKFSNVKFHVCNMNRGERIEKRLNFYGTPTICMIKTGDDPKTWILADPDNPNDKTWYYSRDIIDFIKENYKK